MNKKVSIQSSELKAEISFTGAELIFLQVFGKENVIWKVDETFWNRSSPILFPIVGRLKHNEYDWKSNKYKMMQHGFARNQNFELVEKSASFLNFQLKSNTETLSQYPFEFVLNVTYELKGNKLLVAYIVNNPGQELLPFSIGGHPGFQLNSKLEDYQLHFPEKFSANRHLIANGLYNGSTESLSVDKEFNLKTDYFESDAIVFKSPQFNEVTLCRFSNPILTLRCPDWSAVGFWTKKNAPFFCIEPWWGWADNTNASGKLSEKDGLIWLNSGKKKAFHFEIEVH
jgi:galactose mutarotase-like enzyme